MQVLIFSLLVVFVYMTLWFIISIFKKRSDVADIAWGLGFVVLSWSLYLLHSDNQILLLASLLVSIWGIRLSAHIYMRNRKKAEDYRYQEMRKRWGNWALLGSYLQVFLLQGMFLVLIAMPLIGFALNSNNVIGLPVFVGVIVWLIGFIFEVTGDLQLKIFVNNPKNKGKIMRYGLWRYTRHPNYFGEVTQWWGIWLLGYGLTSFLWTIIGPITITFLILKVSGIPLLEKRYVGNKEYEKYKRQTSVFIPWVPKKG
ncbi:DUF1295 domain-containing protein [Candidatus Saccharibacteria bacterium]|nr:DUF1295 domain-containing protein [Candidatus Saccharibacteria bacterium]